MLRILALFIAALGLAGCHLVRSEQADVDGDEEIAVAQVPGPVMAAATKAVPGLRVTAAEMESENGVSFYSLEGEADGKPYCVEVSPEGKVLEIEQEGRDEDEAGDHDVRDDDEAGRADDDDDSADDDHDD